MFQVGCSRDVSMTCGLHTRNFRLLFLILDSHISSFINFLSFSLLLTLGRCAIYVHRSSVHSCTSEDTTTQFFISLPLHTAASGCRGCLIHILSVSPMPRFNGSLARASTGRATTNVAISITINQPMHTRRFGLSSDRVSFSLFSVLFLSHTHTSFVITSRLIKPELSLLGYEVDVKTDK